MYLTTYDALNRTPLDFNTPPPTDSVADALVSEPALHKGPRAPGPESLLAEIGLPPHRVRQVLAEARASSFPE